MSHQTNTQPSSNASVYIYGPPHGTGAWISALLQMSVDTGADEKIFVDLSLTISSLVHHYFEFGPNFGGYGQLSVPTFI